MQTHHQDLPDGRRLTYTEHGPRDGHPVMWMHGFGGSRFECSPDASAADEVGARVLVVDRPGIGGSTRHPGRTLRIWGQDVGAFADALGIEGFSVGGVSWGGPHALACAATLGDRITRLGLVSSPDGWLLGTAGSRNLGSSFDLLRTLLRFAPWAARAGLAAQTRSVRRAPDRALDRAIAGMTPREQELCQQPEVRAMLVAKVEAAVAQGTVGAMDDTWAVAREWDVDPTTVDAPTIIWHGDADTEVSVAAAEHLHRQILGSELHVVPDAGHQLFLTHWRQIIDSIVPAG